MGAAVRTALSHIAAGARRRDHPPADRTGGWPPSCDNPPNDAADDRPVLRVVRHTVESNAVGESWRRATWQVEFDMPAGSLVRARQLCEELEAVVRRHTRESAE